MADFIQFVNKLSKLDKEATDELINKLQTKTIEKGEYLLKNGEQCIKIFFIDQGLAKTCFNSGDKEFIMRFFPENSMFTVLKDLFYIL
jgi:CRP-like cAMP-binding protein